MICNSCKCEIEYDEGIGNSEDGYICFECKENNDYIFESQLIDSEIDNQIEEMKFVKFGVGL